MSTGAAFRFDAAGVIERKPSPSAWLRATALAATALLVSAVPLSDLCASRAFADTGLTGPPETDFPPPGDSVSKENDYEQQYFCRKGTHFPKDINFTNPTWGQRSLDLDKAHQISTGAGVQVAVIDTGVSHVPRLDVRDGGDYVQGEGQGGHGGDTHGGDDCDAHGTFVAGLIAGKPSPDGRDKFVGVAPDAQIIAIRQTSEMFHPKNGGQNDHAGNLHSLALAVRHAADMGAKVINVSIASCFPAAGFDQNEARSQDQLLGAALKYAAEERDAVVVAAAGNLQQGDKGSCKDQNPDYDATQHYDPTKPHDPNSPYNPSEWEILRTVVSPAWWMQYVLAVGWVDKSGQPAGLEAHGNQNSGTIAGPWIGIAAPGDEVISLNPLAAEEIYDSPNADLANATPGENGGPPAGIQGTSFASPLVAGAAALLRSQHPDWDHQQVIEQLERTAIHSPRGRDNYIGHGLLDIVAALTEQPAPPGDFMRAYATKPLAPPRPVPPPDNRPRNFGLVVSGIALALLAIGAVASIPLRDARRTRAGGKK